MFERRKDVSDVGQAVLRPRLRGDGQAVRPLATLDLRLPFAIAAVEHQDLFAGREPQHIAQIIALVAFEFDPRALLQGGVDEQAGGAKVEFRHVGCPIRAAF